MVTIRHSFYMEVADDTLSGMIKIARCQNSDIFKIKGLRIDDFYLLLAIHKNLKEKLVLLTMSQLVRIICSSVISPLP